MRYWSSKSFRTEARREGVKWYVKTRPRLLESCKLVLSTIEYDKSLPVICMNLSKAGISDEWNEMLTNSGLQKMLETKHYQSLEIVISFVVSSIYQSTESEKAGSKKRNMRATVRFLLT